MTSSVIPVNLITGFLGVGKTTALMNLLAQKPADEYWAIVVNEFGEVGIDGATLSSAGDGLQVAEVPGGCICCTTSPMLRVTLGKLARGIRPDRLLIEPSGLGHPAGIIDLLRDPMLASAFEVRAVVSLLDPRQMEDSRYYSHETWRDQLQLADVLVINKCDVADEEQILRAEAMGAAFFPPKLAITRAINGQFDLSLLDLELHPERWPALNHSANVQLGAYSPSRQTHSTLASKSTDSGDADTSSWPICKMQSSLGSHSCGWIFPPEVVFSSSKVADLLTALSQNSDLNLQGLTRAKGIFHTERDWYRFDWVDSMTSAAPAAYRRDSRFEVIVQSDQAPDWLPLQQALVATLISSPSLL
ncbi:CobW family GTP-binding protein [Deefgea piscis]|uniref:CobW family GTP-binding protein n=1 Tax=Deefgea piscis TaxID=2739061 RepID=UPI001C807FDB|nr:GTP-binding protein [Deefgea piscis]QZA81566.1 GTP-binding protein [Deefgea piscis]